MTQILKPQNIPNVTSVETVAWMSEVVGVVRTLPLLSNSSNVIDSCWPSSTVKDSSEN